MSLDATFAALSDPTRRAVVDLLRRAPRRAGELSEALAMSPPAMSRHLRVLRECGLVEEERPEEDARGRVLRLRPEPFDELRDWIAEVEQFWTGQLAAFQAYAERRHTARTNPPRTKAPRAQLRAHPERPKRPRVRPRPARRR